MNTAVVINDLSVTLGEGVQALRNVSLELPAGQTIGVIGPSGAGKTTLIKAIVGRLKTPQPAVRVLGRPAGTAGLRRHVSYMTQGLSVYPDLTVRENIAYFVTMAGQPKSAKAAAVRQVLEAVDLTDKVDTMVASLSGGQKQRASLAIALIGSPELMVLDEPTVGLDPVLRDKLWNLFGRLAAGGTTLVISSHSMDEAARCDDLVLLRDGAVIAHSTPHELLKRTGSQSVEESFLALVGVGKRSNDSKSGERA